MSNGEKKQSPPVAVTEEPLSKAQIQRAAMLRGLIFGTIVGLGFYGYRHGWFTSDAPMTAAEEAQTAERVAQQNLEFGKSLDRTNATYDWQNLARELNDCRVSLSSVITDTPAIRQEMTAWETSDDGRKVSDDERCLEYFATWRAWSPPTDASIEALIAEIDSQLGLCNAAIENQSIIIRPDEEFRARFKRLSTDARAIGAPLTSAIIALDYVKRAAAGKEPQGPTIAEVLDERELAKITELQRERTAIREKAWEEKLRAEIETETAVAAEEKAAREVQQRIRLEEAQSARQKEELRLKTMQEERIAAEEKKRKLANFEKALPEIRSLLAPMISVGTQQLGDSGWGPGERGPVSFGRLQKCRSLQLDERGMYMLGSIFCDVHDKNDRPQGSFPMEMASGGSKGTIRRAQELLNEYGEILVEKVMMAP